MIGSRILDDPTEGDDHPLSLNGVKSEVACYGYVRSDPHTDKRQNPARRTDTGDNLGKCHPGAF